jgi:hypothetical protein
LGSACLLFGRWQALAAALVVLAFLGGYGGPALAQTAGQVRLQVPDLKQFPTIQFYFEVLDASGRALPDLQPSEIEILEDGAVQTVSELVKQEPGVHVIVALNPGPLMETHIGSEGMFEKIQKNLAVWSQSIPAETRDTFSLTTHQGLTAARVDAAKWLEALNAYQPDLSKLQPNLTSLSQALDTATDPNPQEQMKRAILYITTPGNGTELKALPNLTDRAAQLGARVFVWLVASPSTNPNTFVPWQQLAERTNGQFVLFTGTEALPEPGAYFESMRILYQATYLTQQIQNGEHKLALRVNRPDLQVTSAEQVFSLAIQPPNPMFLSPPPSVKITSSTSQDGKTVLYSPASVSIKILVEFPDQMTRALKRSTLYVDGKPVTEKLAPPFEELEWKFEGENIRARHLLKVEVEDVLGLKKTSFETPIEIIPESTELISNGAFLGFIPESFLIAGAGILALSLLAVGVTFGVRILLRRRTPKPKTSRAPKNAPAMEEKMSPPSSVPTQQSPWPRILQSRPAMARLMRLGENGQPVAGGALSVNLPEITIGSQPRQALYVLDSPSVNALHARLRQADGQYLLQDCDSLAGVWVNFNKVGGEGAVLKHGDLVQIGRVSLRFELMQAPALSMPIIQALDETL